MNNKEQKSKDKERIRQSIIIDSNGCWIWQKAKKGNNRNSSYGQMQTGSRKNGTRKRMLAHRFSYEAFKGEIPIGLCVCHKCDNPPCVNPDHLFLGTRQDNIKDREEKGRNNPVFGESHFKAKITESQALSILEMRKNKIKIKEIASKFNISIHVVKDISARRNWKHINV